MVIAYLAGIVTIVVIILGITVVYSFRKLKEIETDLEWHKRYTDDSINSIYRTINNETESFFRRIDEIEFSKESNK